MNNIICFYESETRVAFFSDIFNDEELMEVYTNITITDMFEYKTDKSFFNITDSHVEECIKRINKIKKSSISTGVLIGWFKSTLPLKDFTHELQKFITAGKPFEQFEGFKEIL